MLRSLAATGLLVLAAGCASTGQRLDDWGGLHEGDRITVLPLADHVSDDPADSVNTGVTCQQLIVTALKQRVAGIDVDGLAPSDYDPRRGYTHDEAVALGRQQASRYVLYGRCSDFYNVASFTFRADRGGIDVEVASVADGKLVYRLKEETSAWSNLGTPQDVIRGIAEDMADEMKAGN